MNVYAVLSVIALVTNITAGVYVLSRNSRDIRNRCFFGVMASLVFWSLGEVVMRVSHTPATALWGSRIAGIGWCLVGGFFVLLALAMTDKERYVLNPYVLAGCFGPATFFLVVLWSTKLVFKDFVPSYWGYREIGGALRRPSGLMVVVLFSIGAVILFRFWRSAPSSNKRAGAGYTLLAMTVPLAAGLATDVRLPLAGRYVPEMPVFASTVIGPIIGYAVIRQGVMTTIAGRLGGTIIMKMNDAVVITNTEGLIESVNPAVSRLTGRSGSELRGVALDTLLASARSKSTGGDRDGEWNLLTDASAEIIPVIISSSEVRKKNGRLLGSVSIIHDMRDTLRLTRAEREVKVVTAQVEVERDRSELQRQTEEEVRKLSRFLESVIENIAEPLFILDARLRYIYVNDAFCGLCGCARADIVGRTDYDLYWKDNADYFTATYRKILDTGDPLELPEIRTVDLDGTLHMTRAIVSPMKSETGTVDYLVGIATDLTEEKKLEQARLDFIRIAAHELRTPLTSLKLGFDMLARETSGALEPEQQRSLDVLSLSIERLSRLSKNLLDLASMDAGLVTLHRGEVEIEPLFAEAAAMFESALKKKGLAVRLDVPGDIRPAYADAARLSQVLYNLLSNAVKYTEVGGITMSALDPGDGMLLVSVTDTGSGIPASAKEAIFSRFVKAQSAETAKEGTGLGLSISKAIVEAHGGTITVQSRLGSGSTFTFSVPAAGAGEAT
jgi:PAS domain S-box-containing protein